VAHNKALAGKQVNSKGTEKRNKISRKSKFSQTANSCGARKGGEKKGEGQTNARRALGERIRYNDTSNVERKENRYHGLETNPLLASKDRTGDEDRKKKKGKKRKKATSLAREIKPVRCERGSMGDVKGEGQGGKKKAQGLYLSQKKPEDGIAHVKISDGRRRQREKDGGNADPLGKKDIPVSLRLFAEERGN